MIRLLLALLLLTLPARAGMLDEQTLASRIEPPYALGERLGNDGLWSLRDLQGADAGYVFETEPLAPLPGFSGDPINVLVTLDREGRFINAELLHQREPVFVSGLGEAPFHAFMRQYRGLSIYDSITVGAPYGSGDRSGSGQVFLDGVTKATASVRIAHESILAAALAIARERMQGLAGGPAPRPEQTVSEALDWNALVTQGIARRLTITAEDEQAAFNDTTWEDDAPDMAHGEPYLDLWVIDIGPESVARAVLHPDTLKERADFMVIADHDEPLLLLANGAHGLVSEDFVRNTAPDLLSAEQDGLPIALRDADLIVDTGPGVPDFEHRMILRTDRRLGFDPTREWTLSVRAVRRHGAFMPEVGVREFTSVQAAPERFFIMPDRAEPRPIWVESLLARRVDIALMGVFLLGLLGALAFSMRALAGHRRYPAIRLGVLAITLGFIGWWGQGQLSIVTAIGVLRAAVEGGSFAFLLYDPFSLVLWVVALGALVVWGRGLFCGWLCPYGAMQEFMDALGRRSGLKRLRVPQRWDRALKRVKYGVLAALLITAIAAPTLNDALVEVEPFKTAITVGFMREWGYALYALFWLALGLVIFKPFCRYLCPLGALLAVGGAARRFDWIARRSECGSPCQLCKVRCAYDAIKPNGKIEYSECFQCLDCVTIHDDPGQCVPLVIAAKRAERAA